MSANSKIEWIGCAKVSPGCANCYADTQDKFRKWTPEGWGKGRPRKRTSAAYWREPLKWNRDVAVCGHCNYDEADGALIERCAKCKLKRPRVFCASLADWLDDEVPIEWLADLLQLIESTPNLDWLLLTKRPEIWRSRIEMASNLLTVRKGSDAACVLTAKWLRLHLPPRNVWLGVSVEDQARAEERIPLLMSIPAHIKFLSCEPLLGPLDLRKALELGIPGIVPKGRPHINWVIVGGESGPHARLMTANWAADLRDQCAVAGCPFFFKQWGEWAPIGQVHRLPRIYERTEIARGSVKCGKKAAGRMLDGLEHNAFPA